eukprot:CAMPEP_0172483948 /NCGR_PEP_ID=MMETSP1066-20121228/11189_1 /TAXON_ID=671091 /ORGANISM="Coscinodiscus wailesii, Strain CCMP2513" /LENGTH=323 /DNA_ID=CAMNT_0013248157 /DNA_START=204 /DNA_END=1172 /DNA_ORIENTATION=+
MSNNTVSATSLVISESSSHSPLPSSSSSKKNTHKNSTKSSTPRSQKAQQGQEKQSISRISVIGEHNSGTTWTKKELERCYSDHFEISNRITRHKHWFQYDTNTTKKTLAIAQFRNPYHWILASMAKPRRSPAHANMPPSSWKKFLTTPWTVPRGKSDDQFRHLDGPVCKEKYRFNEIVSCHDDPPPDEYVVTITRPSRTRKGRMVTNTKQIEPWYELRRDGSGEPFSSILELRTEKIRNHVTEVSSFRSVAGDAIVVRYEELVKRGTGWLLDEIERRTGVAAHCDPTEGQVNRTTRVVEKEMIDYVNENLDWEVENIIGYEKW